MVLTLVCTRRSLEEFFQPSEARATPRRIKPQPLGVNTSTIIIIIIVIINYYFLSFPSDYSVQTSLRTPNLVPGFKDRVARSMPDRVHAWVAGLVPSRGTNERQLIHVSPSHPLPLFLPSFPYL